jgi:tripartite-type tricarboxylate transporter receptor subunit TctC
MSVLSKGPALGQPDRTRRNILMAGAGLGAALLLGTRAAFAAYPEKPVRIVVPLAAGGPTDVLARLVAEAMTPILGQQVIVENRTGASGQIAVDYVARADADGYTILMATLGTVILPQTNAGFDAATLDKLQPISKIEGRAVYLAASASLPADNIAELIEYAKANPGKVKYAAQGASDILGIGQMNKLAGTDIPVVRYQGGAPALQAVVADQVQLTLGTPGAVAPFVTSGQLKIIAVTSPERLPALPDVPAIAEAVPGYEFISWTGLAAPAGTPQEAIDRIAAALKEALSGQAMIDRLKEFGTTPSPDGPEAFTAFFKAEIERWAEVAKSVGFTPQ